MSQPLLRSALVKKSQGRLSLTFRKLIISCAKGERKEICIINPKGTCETQVKVIANINSYRTLALVDLGATRNFILQRFVNSARLVT